MTHSRVTLCGSIIVIPVARTFRLLLGISDIYVIGTVTEYPQQTLYGSDVRI